MKRRELIATLIVFVVCIAAFYQWKDMPLYPDEIATRIQSTRYIQDDGKILGLYPVCRSNIKKTPLVFEPFAWALSRLELATPVHNARILNIIVVLCILMCVLGLAFTANYSFLVALSGLVGVAGSGLILSRPEALQLVNLLAVLATYWLVIRGNCGWSTSLLGTALLVGTCFLSIYSHPQGLLLLPATALMVYALIRRRISNLSALLLSITVLTLGIVGGIKMSRFACDEAPHVGPYARSMTAPGYIQQAKMPFFAYLKAKARRYTQSFQYMDNYDIGYLPPVGHITQRVAVRTGNFLIGLIVIFNLMLVALYSALLIAKGVRIVFRTTIIRTEPGAAFDVGELLFVALALSALALFIYDASANFYRNFYLGLCFAVLAALAMATIRIKSLTRAIVVYSITCLLLVVWTITANARVFAGKLASGFSGPSIPLATDWSAVRDNVLLLSKRCNVDLARGGIIIDDLTYQALKQSPSTYAITYMLLTGQLEGKHFVDLLQDVQPRAMIVRCGFFSSTEIPFDPQAREGGICCAVFSGTENRH